MPSAFGVRMASPQLLLVINAQASLAAMLTGFPAHTSFCRSVRPSTIFSHIFRTKTVRQSMP